MSTALKLTTAVLLTIPVGKYFIRIFNLRKDDSNLLNNSAENFDKSLRNFHPNKGE